MRRRDALRAKVVLRLHDAAPEKVLPHAIDGHARQERIVAIGDPAGEVEPVPVRLGQAVQHRRRPRLHLLGRTGEIALHKPASRARLSALGHHQSRRCAWPRLFKLGQAGLERLALGILLGQGAQLSLELLHARAVLGAPGQDFGRRRLDARLVGVVEKGKQPVILDLRNGVELVIVALRAAKRQAEHHLARRGDAVKNRVDAELLLVHTALGVDLRVAVKPGGDALGQRGVGQHVAGELLDDKPVKRHVAVRCIDHPIAVRPHRPACVVAVAVGVGVARRVQPVAPPALAVVRRLQQPVHHLFERVRTCVRDKRSDLRRGRRQAGQVETHAAQQRRLGRLRRRRDTRLRLLGGDENIDRVFRPRAPVGRQAGQQLANRFFKRPMPVVLAAGLDPFAQQRHLLRGQAAVRLRRRHPRVGVGGRDARQQLALGQVRRIDCPHAVARLGRALARVKTQTGLALGRVRSVALETVLRKHRPDVPIEIDPRSLRIGQADSQRADQDGRLGQAAEIQRNERTHKKRRHEYSNPATSRASLK